MTNIFEQPWLLVIVSGIVFLAVVVFRNSLPQRRKWLFWLLPFVIAGLAFAIDFYVQTDTETIKDAIAGAAGAVERENVQALEPLISNDYQDSFNQSKQVLLRRCGARLSEPIIEKNVARIVSLSVNPPNAEAIFTVRVVFDPRGPVYQYRKMMLFKLRADFRKQGEDWFFSRIEVIEIDLHPADWRFLQGGGEIFD